MEILKDEFDSVIDRLLSCHVGVCTCESGTVSDDTLYSGHRKVVFTFTPRFLFFLQLLRFLSFWFTLLRRRVWCLRRLRRLGLSLVSIILAVRIHCTGGHFMILLLGYVVCMRCILFMLLS